VGARGGSKSDALGGGSTYLRGESCVRGAGVPGLGFCLLVVFVFGSGVALEVGSAAREPPLDSRFFNDSFLDLAARSRATGASDFAKSGLSGEDTAG
jgi:hypothetical protein